MAFDFCRYGMARPVHAYPIKKRTKLRPNIGPVASRFKNAFCACVTKYPLKGGLDTHLTVDGHDEGIQVSAHCQTYPPRLVVKLLRSACMPTLWDVLVVSRTFWSRCAQHICYAKRHSPHSRTHRISSHLNRSLTHLTSSLTYSFTHSRTRLSHFISLTRSLTHILTHSLTPTKHQFPTTSTA